MRDIVLEETIYLDFTTRAFATGVPTVLAGSPVLSVLEENNATPITAGVSVSVDRASVVGLNMATIVATAANGYENGKGYSVYISTGTVGGVSVVGEKVAEFTIGASAAAQDLANGTDGLTALKTGIDDVPTVAEFNARSLASADYTIVSDLGTVQTADHTAAIADIPTVAEFNARTLAAASYFDPAADTVANVTMVATTTTNTDMRGTDSANTVVPPSVAQFNARTLLAADYFDPATDAVANVTLCATTTTNTDMRGTDSAFLAASAPTNFSALGINVGGDISVVTLVDTTTTNTDMRGTDGANTTVPDAAGVAPTATEITADMDANSTQLALIVADTSELQTDWANGGRLDVILDARAAEATVAALNDISTANVNTEVVDVLFTDTHSELSSIPAANAPLADKINYIFMNIRNKMTQTATTATLLADDTTTSVGTSTVSDDGTTATKGEWS